MINLSESADADDPDVHAALEGAPLLERGVHRDAGAEDGAGRLQRVALRDLKNLNFILMCGQNQSTKHRIKDWEISEGSCQLCSCHFDGQIY